MVLSQKHGDGCYHPAAFGSHSLTLVEKNYHGLKLEFLVLKWCNRALQGVPGVCTFCSEDGQPADTTPNLDATGHQWVGVLASFEFSLEYQKGADNGAADTLSWVPVKHDHVTVQSLLEGAIIGAADRSEAEANESLLCKHVCLAEETRV